MLKPYSRYLSPCLFSIALWSCASDDPEPSCDNPPEVISKSTTPTSTCDSADGSLTVSASGGVPPIEFSIDNGITFQADSTFSNLSVGTYTVFANDAEGCTSNIQITIDPSGTDLAASASTTADTQCFEDNGTIEVTATGGQPPYAFNMGDGFVTSNTFSELSPGNYVVIIKDASGCFVSIVADVDKGDTGTSYAQDIDPIIMTSCAISGCHNGDLGPGLDYTVLANLQAHAEQAKSRTQSGDMPRNGTITDEQIALIACWVDEGAKDN